MLTVIENLISSILLVFAIGAFISGVEFLDDVGPENGGVVLTLLAGIWFLYRSLSILRVLSATMQSKDREIARLTLDRDRYQAMVVERLRFLESLHRSR